MRDYLPAKLKWTGIGGRILDEFEQWVARRDLLLFSRFLLGFWLSVRRACAATVVVSDGESIVFGDALKRSNSHWPRVLRWATISQSG